MNRIFTTEDVGRVFVVNDNARALHFFPEGLKIKLVRLCDGTDGYDVTEEGFSIARFEAVDGQWHEQDVSPCEVDEIQ